MDKELSRRAFLKVAGAAGVALVGAGCSKQEPERKEPDPIKATKQADGSFVVPGAGALEPGMALRFALPDNTMGIVFLTGDGQLGAVNSKCTHNGCPVNFVNSPEPSLLCPCHESRFKLDGTIIPGKGPATKPLPAFKVSRKGGDAVVSLAA